jgi:hypothetical protein
MRYVVSSLIFLFVLLLSPLAAQQNPYFVTYDHHMEEPGSLELSTEGTIGIQKQDFPGYLGQLFEMEYGITGWWSSALYLESTYQHGDSPVFSGFRLENRFRLLKSDHRINPVLYFEYEHINEASRIRKEIMGHAEPSDESLAELAGETEDEIEAKLIFSSNVKNWNISENFIVEKNLTEDEGFEFGYAIGVFRPLSTLATGGDCRFCRENFSAGFELYGGLGSTERFGFEDTAHYLAPAVVWNLGRSHSIKVSPGFGLTGSSDRMLVRFGYTYEIYDFGRKVSRMFRGNQ